jgi:hypothetical protein
MAHLLKSLTEAPEVVILLLYLVVPGFIFIRIYDVFAPGERRSLGEAIIDTVGSSFIFMMFWFWPFAALYEYRDSLPPRLRYLTLAVLTVLAAFVTPILGAYLIHRLRRSRYLTGSISRPSPTPWEVFFSATADNYYVRFYLRIGENLVVITATTPLQRLSLMGKRSTLRKCGDWMRMGALPKRSREPRVLLFLGKTAPYWNFSRFGKLPATKMAMNLRLRSLTSERG